MGRHTGLGGLPGGHHAIERCEAVARPLKTNVDGAACQDAGRGRSFPMWILSRAAKSVTSVHSAGEEAKNSPGNRYFVRQLGHIV